MERIRVTFNSAAESVKERMQNQTSTPWVPGDQRGLQLFDPHSIYKVNLGLISHSEGYLSCLKTKPRGSCFTQNNKKE